MAASAFSKQFNDRLKRGKYTRWAAELGEDQLEALLWGIGEYNVRLAASPTISDDQTSIIVPCRNGYQAARMKVGLHTISRVVRRENINQKDVARAVVEASQKAMMGIII